MKTTYVSSVFTSHIRWPKLTSRLQNWKARQGVRELADADDWLLKDIGLTRNDITWALGLPLSVNSADELNKRVYRGRTAASQKRRQDRGPSRDRQGEC